jgi:hypothetical protein
MAVGWRFMGGMHPKGANGGPDRLIAAAAEAVREAVARLAKGAASAALRRWRLCRAYRGQVAYVPARSLIPNRRALGEGELQTPIRSLIAYEH